MLSTPNDEQKGKAPSQNRQVEKWCEDKLLVKKRDSRWHCQMGLVLSGLLGELRDETEARARCHEAIHLDKKNWRASFLLATLIDSHEEAKEILKKLISRFKNDSNWMEENEGSLAQMTYLLGCRYWAQKKFKKAIDWFMTGIKHGLEESSFVLDILLKYQSTGERWNEITVLVEQMHSSSLLTPVVVELATKDEFHEVIFRAVVETKNFEVFDRVYQNAIKFAEKAADHLILFELRQSYANALSACPSTQIDQVRGLLEDAARDVPYTNTDMALTFFVVGYRLGTIYLDNAKRAKEARKEDEAKQWLDRMATIIPEQVKEAQMRLPLRLFAARYHHINGNKEAAWSCAHNTLKMAMELMADGESTNDFLAYQKVLYAVIPFEDKINAATALALMKMEAPGGKLAIPCSCRCGHVWQEPGDMWWCMDCINVVLTTKCKNAVKDKNVCRPSHNHFQIPPWDKEKMKNVPKNLVPWNGESISLKEWTVKITKAYHLTK